MSYGQSIPEWMRLVNNKVEVNLFLERCKRRAMGIPVNDFQAKVLGMIQCNAGPALQVEVDRQLNTVLIYRDVTEEDRQLHDIPHEYARRLLVEMDRDLFDSLSVHDILKKAGVPRK